MKVILVNGPPRCGKDTLGHLLVKHLPNGKSLMLAPIEVELKERCHGAYRLYHGKGVVPHNAFEAVKEMPSEYFEGRSPRDAYISFFRSWVKPVCGEDALGRWLVARIERLMKIPQIRMCTKGIIALNVGRRADCMPIVTWARAENCTLIKLTRDGCSYKGDSREDVNLDDLGVPTISVRNPGDHTFLNRVREAAPHLFIETEVPLS
jgi:hypothetical protein